MGREKGQEVMLPSLAPQGWRATMERALSGQGTTGTGQGQRQLGLRPLTMGRGPTELGAGSSPPAGSLPEPSLQFRAQPTALALPPKLGRGRDFLPRNT